MSLIGIDRFLTALTLRAEEVEHQYSQRVGRWMQETLIWGHERFGSMRRKIEGHRRGVHMSKVARRSSQHGLPRYPSLFLSSKGIPKTAAELVEGKIDLGNGRTIRIEDLAWLEDPLGGTFSVYRLLFHALEWVDDLMVAYQRSNRPEYLLVAQKVTQKWISECLHKEGVGNVWSDHGTGLRAIILCRLWMLCQDRESEDSIFLKNLYEAIVRHGEKLSNPTFYRNDHNHGIVQAYGLFAIGVCVPSCPMSDQWEALGRQWLEGQAVDNVSTEGLHCEHSPYYHFFVFRHFFYAYQLALDHGKIFSQEFTSCLQSMLQAGCYLIKPNGKLVAFGDTSNGSPILIEQAERAEWPIQSANEFLYGSSQGMEGHQPKEASVLFPQAGFACLRSGWGTTELFEQERCMAIRTGTFPTSHIHRDVGTFELYGFGDDLIVDSGGPYAYGHPFRNPYFVSTHAHNTVVVDGQDQHIGTSRICHWDTNDHLDFLQIQHANYPGVTHNRSFVFIRPGYFLILDQLESQQIHHYSQLFHLNENLQVTLKDMVVATENSLGGPTLRIVPFFVEGLGLRLHHGSFNPGLGWRCLAEKSMTPNAVLDYHQVGRSARFGVLLVPEKPKGVVPVNVEALVDESSDSLRIRVGVETRLDEIVIPASGNVTLERVKA